MQTNVNSTFYSHNQKQPHIEETTSIPEKSFTQPIKEQEDFAKISE